MVVYFGLINSPKLESILNCKNVFLNVVCIASPKKSSNPLPMPWSIVVFFGNFPLNDVVVVLKVFAASSNDAAIMMMLLLLVLLLPVLAMSVWPVCAGQVGPFSVLHNPGRVIHTNFSFVSFLPNHTLEKYRLIFLFLSLSSTSLGYSSFYSCARDSISHSRSLNFRPGAILVTSLPTRTRLIAVYGLVFFWQYFRRTAYFSQFPDHSKGQPPVNPIICVHDHDHSLSLGPPP